MILINILNEPRQRFSIIVGRFRVTMELWYSVSTDRWSLDLAIDGEPVLVGRRIVTGVDLLEPFDFGIGAVFAWPDSEEFPNRDALPLGSVKFYHITETERQYAEVLNSEVVT